MTEAAHVAIRCASVVRRVHQRKAARTTEFVALKAVAHKLARACYPIVRDEVPFQITRAFTA